jgi:hypothetical protein
MSPVAAECDSADSAPGYPDPLAVVDGNAEVVVLIDARADALLVEVDGDLPGEDPHPAISAAPASAHAHADL